jgi:hypothetical protein
MTTNWTPTSTTRTQGVNIEVRAMSKDLGDTLPEMFVRLSTDLGLLSVRGHFHNR